MEAISQTKPVMPTKQRIWIMMFGILLVVLIISAWVWRNQSTRTNTRPTEVETVPIVSTTVIQNDVPVKLTANGTVSAKKKVEVRPQISALIKAVHIKEGQFVRKGDKLFTLDARTENANLSKAKAQLAKSNADLANAVRNHKRQRELFQQKFISQAALDTAQSQVDSLQGQLDADRAAVQANRVMRGFTEITAPISGRTGVIPVHPGSLVQPNIAIPGSLTQPRSAVLVSITQIDPINISFTLPERELVALQQARAKGDISVSAELDLAGKPLLEGRLIFVDNTVDTESGSIRLKAEFPNVDQRLWPGMFVTVMLSPDMLVGALTVPVQAVQTGPEKKFLYVIGENSKVTSQTIKVRLVQDGLAVIEGAVPGTRVVLEGAQNLRPGSTVVETQATGGEVKPGNNVSKIVDQRAPDKTGRAIDK
jgi:multidrug efflux system membrane fusion protein